MLLGIARGLTTSSCFEEYRRGVVVIFGAMKGLVRAEAGASRPGVADGERKARDDDEA